MTTSEILHKKDIYIYDRVWIDGCPETTLVDVNEEGIIEAMKEYARIKCLEAIENVRHKACDIIEDTSYYNDYLTLEINVQHLLKDIQNIPNKDVMPEL